MCVFTNARSLDPSKPCSPSSVSGRDDDERAALSQLDRLNDLIYDRKETEAAAGTEVAEYDPARDGDAEFSLAAVRVRVLATVPPTDHRYCRLDGRPQAHATQAPLWPGHQLRAGMARRHRVSWTGCGSSGSALRTPSPQPRIRRARLGGATTTASPCGCTRSASTTRARASIR
jgi:hypothetical protein